MEHEADHGERDHGLYNAPMESFSGSLKTELDVDGPFETRQAVCVIRSIVNAESGRS